MRERDYYGEIEEHFRLAIGKPLYRTSPKEWQMIESWEKAGIELDVVLRGIDVACRPQRRSLTSVASLCYCDYAVMGLATRLMAGTQACECGERYDPLRAGWKDADRLCLKCSQAKEGVS